ncbi:MAG: PDZ domain-containing protein [Candidatus Syntrophonatronum acetioxidans]|uniref:PDZ domain-containing protein n=1 Tax=Candidatus Syntrophonatronum acetioxidans TaxID=1795816 RepID=A0A424YBS2_9FIRM|nr:MAG: PDZ domain-containing protein [Candidatus Syntrophonatronum acetioxidans]
MKDKRLIVALLCGLLIISNIATYHFAMNILPEIRGEEPVISPVEEKEFEGDPEIDQEEDLENLELFIKVLNLLQERYIEEVPVEKLVRGAIDGMIEALDDPQTSFLDRDELKNLFIQTTGTFNGIGIEVTMVDDRVTVIAPIKGTPGEKAGLAPGDQIVEVDGENIEGLPLLEAINIIRGPEGTAIKLTVIREGAQEPLEFEVVRESIMLETVDYHLTDKGFGYIQISNFDEQTGIHFRRALENLEEKNMEGLIIDLRNNPGGLLQSAIEVGREVVPRGPITYMVDGQGEVLNTYSSFADPRPYPMVVLVNSFSASASEVVAGALQDSGAAVLIGEPTFGKATVQNIHRFFAEEAGMRYTVAKYLTPAKRDINEEGLQPDFEEELPRVFYFYRFPFTRHLSLGDYGDDVYHMQEMLELLGYPCGEEGLFDDKTGESLKKFQGEMDIEPQGVLDDYTARKLREEVKESLPLHDTQLKKAEEYLEGAK